MRPELLRLASELSGRGESYALATVVWRRSPSSSKEGATALITADRSVRGWIGGACAEPTVVREALRAIDEGSPRLLFLGPPDELAEHRRDGVVAVPIACQSEGALEVYVEPVLPAPLLVAIGRSPAALALTSMTAGLGWRSIAVDDGGEPARHPGVDRLLTSLDALDRSLGSDASVVVATQGHYDEAALEAALATDAAYVGLVASRRRAESVLGYLRDRGVSDEDLERVHAPAGIDLGHVAPEEIAVAILAEIVRERAAGRAAPPGAPAAPRHEAIDPVCGMTVDVEDARYRTVHDGRTVYFCSAGCLQSFSTDPSRFADAAP